MIRRPPRSTQSRSSAASDVYKRQDVYSYDPATNSVEKRGDETSGPIRLQIGITDALWRSCEGNPGRLALFRLAHEWPNAGSLERIPTFNSSSPWSLSLIHLSEP